MALPAQLRRRRHPPARGSSIPPEIEAQHAVLARVAASKSGGSQHFSTAVLVKGSIDVVPSFGPQPVWLEAELHRFRGNLVAAEVTLARHPLRFRVLSLYSPAWPLSRERFASLDTSQVKLTNSPDFWVTDILFAALQQVASGDPPWIVAGDLNCSVTFDTLWKRGWFAQELFDRMASLGFVECLCTAQERLTPTFRNPRGGKVIHQLDHLFVSGSLAERLRGCETGDPERVFESSWSDHLPIVAVFE